MNPVICGDRSSDYVLRIETYHAQLGLLSDEGVSEDLGQSAHPEGDVVAVPPQGTDALLETDRRGHSYNNNFVNAYVTSVPDRRASEPDRRAS